MRIRYASFALCFASLFGVAHAGRAQLPRTRTPGAQGPPSADGQPRNAKFPYTGTWSGERTMPEGSDHISFVFTAVDDHYSGVTLHPDGSRAPQLNLTATAAGLRWEQPNSGGGTWVFQIRLASPDSLVGTLTLRDAPPIFNPVPHGTIVMTRQAPSAQRKR